MTALTTEVSGVPYCNNCYNKLHALVSFFESGVGIGPIRSPQGRIGTIFYFRSPTYARMFRDLNGCYEQKISLDVDRL